MRDDVVADGTTVLFDRGVLGVVVVALAWVVWWLLRREAKRADAAQAQNDALNARVRDDVLPAVLNAATQYAAVTALLTRVGELLPDVAAALRDYDRGRR
jgi:hypothetical protein